MKGDNISNALKGGKAGERIDKIIATGLVIRKTGIGVFRSRICSFPLSGTSFTVSFLGLSII